MRIAHGIPVMLVVVLISSCGAPRDSLLISESEKISIEMLLDANPIMAGVQLKDGSSIDPLELSPEMKAFVDQYADRRMSKTARLRNLIYAVMAEGTFDLIYDETTRTAQETFRDQRGNCLSFTNMFVAMSRYVGLDANFQEVFIPPDWSMTGQFYIFSQHVNVNVNLGSGFSGQDQVIDFNMDDFRMIFDRQIISDKRARAHYFNNIGVEHMLAGDTTMAFANFRESIREEETFSPSWTNLGILSLQEGLTDYAEAAYLNALEADSINLVAMSNLASLYEKDGRTELAEYYRNRVKSHRMHNPYYRYQLAQTAFGNGDYDTSIEHLQIAIREKGNDDSFYFLMSMNYLMKGEKNAAQNWMKKAEEAAPKDIDKKRYHNKFDMLIRSDVD
jgi:tetratricopeptide (TPR) repeat protein